MEVGYLYLIGLSFALGMYIGYLLARKDNRNFDEMFESVVKNKLEIGYMSSNPLENGNSLTGFVKNTCGDRDLIAHNKLMKQLGILFRVPQDLLQGNPSKTDGEGQS